MAKPISFGNKSPFESIRRIGLVIAGLFALYIFLNATLTRIDAAHVGIRIKLAGSARGVQDIPVVTGWVFYNPLTEQIISFPTSVQNVTWTRGVAEGRPIDESITFSSQEGVNVNADIGLSFHIESAKAPHLYLRFRQPDLMALADGYMRNAVREAFNDVASRMMVQDVYGAGKSKLLQDVVEKVRAVLGKDGFLIDQLTINGALRLPENVASAINRAMEATQTAIQAENRVRQVRAEAEQAVAEAHGLAEAARQRAQGEGDAILIKAQAEAKANEIIRLSVTGTVLQYRSIERWDGKLPAFQSSDKLPMLTMDVGKLAMSESERTKRLAELLVPTANVPFTTGPAPNPSPNAAPPPPPPPAPAPAPVTPQPPQ